MGRWVIAFFLVTLAVYLLSPIRWNFDSYLAFPTARSVVYERSLSIRDYDTEPILNHYGRQETLDGDVVNLYPWTVSVALVPAVVVTDLASRVLRTPSSEELIESDRMGPVQGITAAVIVALAAALVVLAAYERLTYSAGGLSSRRRVQLSLLVGAGFAFGTAAWSTASRGVWQHGPSLLGFSIAVVAAQRLATRAPGRAWTQAAALGASVAACYTFRPTNAWAVVVFTLWIALTRRDQILAFIAGAVGVALPWMMVNLQVWNQLIPPYHLNGELSLHDQYALALAGNLVSPARGLLIYSPVILVAALSMLPPVQRLKPAPLRRLDAGMLAIFLLVLLSVSAFGQNWWGGHSYGPRFLVDTMVFLAVIATSTLGWLSAELDHKPRRVAPTLLSAVLVLSLVWSVFANAQSGLFRETQCWNGSPNIDESPWRAWDWSDPQFLAGINALRAGSTLRGAIFSTCN